MGKRAWSRFLSHRPAVFGAVLVALTLFTAIFGPAMAPKDPGEQFRGQALDAGIPVAPFVDSRFPLGADQQGRDGLSRLLVGARTTLEVALFATLIATFIGLAIGLLSGFVGGFTDFFAMRGVDLILSLPFLLIALTLRRVTDSTSQWSVAILLGVLSWTTLARVTRTKAMEVRKMDFALAAEALGIRSWRILLRHVLPNVLGPVAILTSAMIARMILVESSMSYLGLGVEPPTPSWGNMLREGQPLLAAAPHLMLLPAACIVIAVFGFNLMGEGVRDALDPRD